MKGIILAGGSGTRLHPLTLAISKQLLPVYDKPMIYYPLSVLISAGIKQILIITTPRDVLSFKELLGTGEKWGIRLDYAIQESPDGLAQAFLIGEVFIGSDDVCLILGDNIFHGKDFSDSLHKARRKLKTEKIASIYGYKVSDPWRYGVINIDKNGKLLEIEEKPENPKSDIAIVGLYFYPNSVVNVAKGIKPSGRGELEITDINEFYLNQGSLNLEMLDRDFIWLDTGTHDSLLEASNIVREV
jgi:glucose-1-phosphate thymidylyltransferase